MTASQKLMGLLKLTRTVRGKSLLRFFVFGVKPVQYPTTKFKRREEIFNFVEDFHHKISILIYIFVKELCEQNIDKFIKNQRNCLKNVTPDLGRLLV